MLFNPSSAFEQSESSASFSLTHVTYCCARPLSLASRLRHRIGKLFKPRPEPHLIFSSTSRLSNRRLIRTTSNPTSSGRAQLAKQPWKIVIVLLHRPAYLRLYPYLSENWFCELCFFRSGALRQNYHGCSAFAFHRL